jgi:hypothetical protein
MPKVTKVMSLNRAARDRAKPRLSLCLAVLACVILSSCGSNVSTIWSTQSESPDGRWIATAMTEEHGGPGNALLQTVVLLKHTKGPKEPIQVLLLTHNDVKSVNLSLLWVAPSRLEVTYRQPVIVDFQAVKCGGVEISLKDLSAGGTSTGSL